MHHNRTTVNVNAAELEDNVRTLEEILLLLGECDLSHCEGDEGDLRDRGGRALAWFFGQVNVAADDSGRKLPYDHEDVVAALAGALTCREGELS